MHSSCCWPRLSNILTGSCEESLVAFQIGMSETFTCKACKHLKKVFVCLLSLLVCSITGTPHQP